MEEEGGVSEMLEAGGIISHGIGRSWDVGGHMAIAVLALVGTGVGAEMGCRAFRGDCTLPDAGDSGSVV